MNLTKHRYLLKNKNERDCLKIKVAECFLRYKCYRHQVSWDEKLDFEEKIEWLFKIELKL